MAKNRIGSALAIGLAGSLAFSAAPALADNDNSAQIYDNICGLTQSPYHWTGTSQEVATSSGVRFRVCKLEQDRGSPLDKALVRNGIRCELHGGQVTYDTKLIATPSGEATIICKFKS